MMKKQISKISMLASLLVAGVINAQEFYTCVPKKSWWVDSIAQGLKQEQKKLENEFQNAKQQINNGAVWKLIESNQTSGVLNMGIYKVEIAGGAGGDGGHGNTDGPFNLLYGIGGNGGKGEVKKEIFFLSKITNYSACVGSKGSEGEGGCYGGGGGSGGSGSAFALSDNTIVINVSGGGGAGGGAEIDRAGAGGGGGGYACQIGGKGGNGNIYNNSGYGGSVGTIIKLSPNLMSLGVSGHEGSNTRGTDSAVGGKGGRTCSNGGKGGWYSRNGADGSSCATPGNGNSGDGYVKIYKYIG